jgi:hypothetical protein
MADLLTHVLVAYILLTVASWWVDWLGPRWVVIGMGGACIPDLQKVDILLDADAVSAALGIPFTYSVTSTLGGVLLLSGAITLLFERRWWRRVYTLLLVGGLAHVALDGLRVWADGRASQWLFPVFPSYRPPTPSLYVTSDPLVPVVAIAVSLFVFAVDRRRDVHADATAPTGRAEE